MFSPATRITVIAVGTLALLCGCGAGADSGGGEATSDAPAVATERPSARPPESSSPAPPSGRAERKTHRAQAAPGSDPGRGRATPKEGGASDAPERRRAGKQPPSDPEPAPLAELNAAVQRRIEQAEAGSGRSLRERADDALAAARAHEPIRPVWER